MNPRKASGRWAIPSPSTKNYYEEHGKIVAHVAPSGTSLSAKDVAFPVLTIQVDRYGDGYASHEGREELSRLSGNRTVDYFLSKLLGILRTSGVAFTAWLTGRPFNTGKRPSPAVQIAWHRNLPLLGSISGGKIFIVNANKLKVGNTNSHEDLIPEQKKAMLYCLSFRPNSEGEVAVGIQGGVSLWTTTLKCLTSLNKDSSSSVSSKSWASFWNAPGSGVVDCVAWHPSGQKLACAGPEKSGFTVWNMNTGCSRDISSGTERVTSLVWSPCGCYLAAASPDNWFYLWDTCTWNSYSWDCKQWGSITSIAWAPQTRMILLAFSKTHLMVVVHVTAEPPQLATHWVPLDLPQLSPQNENRFDGFGESAGCVHSMAWDDRGRRLAVALGDPHPAAGCIAIFDTIPDRSISPRFIGYARPAEVTQDTSDPVTLSFQPNCKEGAFLAIRTKYRIGFLRMVFKDS